MVVQLKLIAAACENMGIGKKNALPWSLKKEMAYFQEMTTVVNDTNKQNAVIMGRRTWLSIPAKYRPLANRINIVLSRNTNEPVEGAHYMADSLEACIKLLEKPPLSDKVESVWITGGENLYKESLYSPICDRIYLTRIMASYDCDTFFPDIPLNLFKKISDPNVPSEIQQEDDIRYTYEVYERIKD